jgi:hypothetical protein
MADGNNGIGPEQVMQMIAANAATSFVGGTNTSPTTVSALHTNFPPSVTYLGQYARVSDLFGSVDDIMRCRWDGVAYRWVPQRPNFTGVRTETGGNIPILPLITPPTLRLTGNLISNMTITPSSTNAFVGQKQTIIQEGTFTIITSTITGLIGSNLTLLGGGTARVIEYGPTGWFPSA